MEVFLVVRVVQSQLLNIRWLLEVLSVVMSKYGGRTQGFSGLLLRNLN